MAGPATDNDGNEVVSGDDRVENDDDVDLQKQAERELLQTPDADLDDAKYWYKYNLKNKIFKTADKDLDDFELSIKIQKEISLLETPDDELPDWELADKKAIEDYLIKTPDKDLDVRRLPAKETLSRYLLTTPDDKLNDYEKSKKKELLKFKSSNWDDETNDQDGTLPSAGIDVPANLHDEGQGAWTEASHHRHYAPRLTYNETKMQQEDMIGKLSNALNGVLNGTNSVLDHTCSDYIPDMILEHIENIVDLLITNKDNALQFPDIVMWWFLGYDKDAKFGYDEQSKLPHFWVNYCKRMKYDNSERKDEYTKCTHRYQTSCNRLQTLIANTTDRNEVKLKLREVTQNYWDNYYRERNALLDKKTTRRKYPEFEYWFWYMLESIQDRDQFYTNEYRLKVYKSDITNKDLALETFGESGKNKSNVEQVLVYFFENNFKQARNQNRTPLALMAVIVFYYALLHYFLKQIQRGILHDPKKPRTKNRQEREQEKEQAQEERRIQNALNASKARIKDKNNRKTCAELSFKIHQRELSTQWKRMQNHKKCIYNTFAFQNVDYVSTTKKSMSTEN
jgi:hypothetical protein